jgi:arylsulfatase A-like enzyme
VFFGDVYRSMVGALDAAVGRVLAALASHGLAEDTIVVFTSDNGGERFSRNWPFSGQKTELQPSRAKSSCSTSA